MAISLNALVTEVQSRVHRTDINTTIQQELLKTITELETKRYWPWRFMRDATTIALASGTYEYSLPSDFGEDLAFNIIETDKYDVLDRVAFEDFVRKWPDVSQLDGGQPTKYTIGYKAGTSGAKRLWCNIPADATYTAELMYFQTRADATSTDFPTSFTELEKMYLIHKAAAVVKQQHLGYSDCKNTPTCHCDACEVFRKEQLLENRYKLQRTRDGGKWKHPKKSGTLIGQYDVRGNQKTYNV
jgi:hypothetical protein